MFHSFFNFNKKEKMMRKLNLKKSATLIAICALLFAGNSFADDQSGKIPITTSSEEALKYYLQGRDLADKLRRQESLKFFEKAVTADSSFALAYLYLSRYQPSAKGIFENFNKAKLLIGKISEGERLWILGREAEINGFPMIQRELYKKLVESYPQDERSHHLLGNLYFNQQEYNLAVEEYKKAIKINPDFSLPYNQLGYVYRLLVNYKEAEKVFKKYLELIPNDPNPHDSYAELLMKIGKYDESIESYKKALSLNPNFVGSHIGIAVCYNYKGKHKKARKQLQKLYDIARDDGERRRVHFALAVSYVDEGKMDKALKELEKGYALAETIDDASAMADDLDLMGNILLEGGKYDKALAKYEKEVELIEKSDLSKEVKDNIKRRYLFDAARVSLMKKDLADAKTKSDEYYKKAKAIDNLFDIQLAHELRGMIALEEKDFDKALEEFQKANQQDTYVLYRMALAYKGKGIKDKAKELCEKVVKFNALNDLYYAFIKNKAKLMLKKM